MTFKTTWTKKNIGKTLEEKGGQFTKNINYLIFNSI